MKQKTSVGDAVSRISAVLDPFDSDEQLRIIAAVSLLYQSPTHSSQAKPSSANSTQKVSASAEVGALDARSYFELKSPTTKIYQLAVAARFLEEAENKQECSKEDLARVFKAARRNFDAKNFPRDIDNAKKLGLFSKGNSKGVHSLSHSGQNFVDALPNTDGVRIRKPRQGRARKAKAK